MNITPFGQVGAALALALALGGALACNVARASNPPVSGQRLAADSGSLGKGCLTETEGGAVRPAPAPRP